MSGVFKTYCQKRLLSRSGCANFGNFPKTKCKVKGNSDLEGALKVIEDTSCSKGLSADSIDQLVDVAACGLQAEAVSKRLLKALIPSDIVYQSSVLKAVSWMCAKKASPSIQCLIIRWILVIYDYMDNREGLHQMYGILFFYLHYTIMCPYVCHLLYLLTRKEDITLFRVRQLLQLQKKLGPQPYLTGLLSIYKHFYPNRFTVVISKTYKSFFPSYDRKWISVARRVYEQNHPIRNVETNIDPALLERLQPDTTDLIVPRSKKRKLNAVPRAHSDASAVTMTSYYDNMATHMRLGCVPFVQIKNFDHIVENIERIEFPSQIGTVLKNHPLKHLISYSADKVVASRFQFWLHDTLAQDLLDCPEEAIKERVEDLLQIIKTLADFLQEGLPDVDSILSIYLQQWNGSDYRPLLLRLLTRCRIYPFQKLKNCLLKPIRRVFMTSSVYFKCQVILALTELLRNHVAYEWPRYQELLERQNSLTNPIVVYCSLFVEEVEDFDPVDVVQHFIVYTSRMCLTALLADANNPLLEHATLEFLCLVSTLHQSYGVPFVLLPEPYLFDTLLVSTNAITVSRLCFVITRYKVSYQQLKTSQRSGQLDVHSNSGINTIHLCNRLILEASDSLWRAKCFCPTSLEKRGPVFRFSLPEFLLEHCLQTTSNDSLFSVYNNWAFLGCARHFIQQELQEETVHTDKIASCKDVFLEFLQNKQLSGLSDFIASFIRRSVANLGNTSTSG